MILYSGQTKYTSTLSFYELFSNPKLAKQCFTDPIYLLELRIIKDIDLKHRYHSGIVLSLMREIHRKDMLPYLYTLRPILQLIGKENLSFLEDLLRYLLDNGEGKEKEEVIELFANTVSEKDKGNIMSMANDFRMEGRHEGLKLGLQQDRQEGLDEVVRNMLADNVSIDVISKFTKLSLEDIKNIQKKYHSFAN
jgi:hypothetical protein